MQLSQSYIARYWLFAGLVVLLLANMMALALVFLKLPLLPEHWQPQALFQLVLVYHVDFSLLFWALSLTALCWLRSLPGRWSGMDQAGLILLVLAIGVMIVSMLDESGRALLSNYVPVMDDALFLFGLGLLVLAVMMVGQHRLRWVDPADHLAGSCLQLSIVACVVTLVVFTVDLFKLSPGQLTNDQAELLFWGAGHSLQAVFLCVLLAGWLQILGVGRSKWPSLLSRGLYVWMALMVLTPLLISSIGHPEDNYFRQIFSYWMRCFSLPVLLWALGFVGWQWKDRRYRQPAVLLSVMLFLLGAVVGAFIRADSLLVPAHYHATTGALNLLFMALIYRWLDVTQQGSLVQLRCYASGVVLMVIGLAMAGWLGVGRKLSAAAQGLDDDLAQLAMLLMGMGAAIALLASFWFVARGLALLSKKSTSRRGWQQLWGSGS